MRIVIALAVIALLLFAGINYVVFSSSLERAYEDALAVAQEQGIQAAIPKYEEFQEAGSWTTIIRHNSMENQWPEDLAAFAVQLSEEPTPVFVGAEDRSVESIRAYLKKEFPDWDGHQKLTMHVAKNCYERGTAFRKRPADQVFTPRELTTEERLIPYLAHLSEDKLVPPDKKQDLAALSSALQTRYQRDYDNYQEWLAKQPKTWESPF